MSFASVSDTVMTAVPHFLGFLLMLGPLIFVHEFGHFLVAKLIGIRVEVFSLGFGPRLFGWKRNHTDYRVSALPLGGYVKMLGENPDEELKGSPEEFQSRKRHERLAVLVMGATMNIIMAIVIMTGLYMHGVSVPSYTEAPAVIGSVIKDSPAERGGLKSMDKVLAVGDRSVPTWSDFQMAVALSPGRTLPFRIVRDGTEQVLELAIGQTERDAMGMIGVYPYWRFKVGEVRPGGPADAAGLLKGDSLLQVAGLEVGSHFTELPRVLTEGSGDPVPVLVSREGKVIETALAPVPGENGKLNPGFELAPDTVLKKFGIGQAFTESLSFNWRNSDLLFRTIRGLITMNLSLKTLSGPIEIFKLSGEAWKSGAVGFFFLMASISLQLGIINLLPIPVLDGGHIFILLIEGVMRRDLNMAVKERLIQVGLVLLVLLMGTVICLDLYKNFALGS